MATSGTRSENNVKAIVDIYTAKQSSDLLKLIQFSLEGWKPFVSAIHFED